VRVPRGGIDIAQQGTYLSAVRCTGFPDVRKRVDVALRTTRSAGHSIRAHPAAGRSSALHLLSASVIALVDEMD